MKSHLFKLQLLSCSRYYIALLERVISEIAKKTTIFEEKKVKFYHKNVPCHKSMKTMAKLHELVFQLLSDPHPMYFPDLASSDFFLFSEHKRMLAGKKFRSDEEVIAKTEVNFEATDKWYQKLYSLYNPCINPKDYITKLNKKINFINFFVR